MRPSKMKETAIRAMMVVVILKHVNLLYSAQNVYCIFGGHCETKWVLGIRRNAEKQKKIVTWEHITAHLVSHQIYLRAPAQLGICCQSNSYKVPALYVIITPYNRIIRP